MTLFTSNFAPALLALLIPLSACTTSASTTPSAASTAITVTESSAQETPNSSPTEPAEPQTDAAAVAAFKKWTTQYNNNEWELQYQTLVSAQQKVISEKRYITCRDEDTSPEATWLRSVSAKANVKTKIPGTSVTLPATVVIARFRVSGISLPVTAHMFYEGGAWRWSMTKENISNCTK